MAALCVCVLYFTVYICINMYVFIVFNQCVYYIPLYSTKGINDVVLNEK